MKSIFILNYGYMYEGHTIVGVYSTLRRARSAADRFVKDRGRCGDYMDIDEYKVDGRKLDGNMIKSHSVY